MVRRRTDKGKGVRASGKKNGAGMPGKQKGIDVQKKTTRKATRKKKPFMRQVRKSLREKEAA